MNIDIKPKQIDPSIRIHNYDEVVLGYTQEEAIQEASRCLNCINHPCVEGCPIHNNIPGFIKNIKENNIQEAYQIISNNSPFPSICSRVCAYEKQCQKNCVRGIQSNPVNIGALERYVCDNVDEQPIKKESNNHKIAIIGSGPSGLTCAKHLAILGYDVTVFEQEEILGGILTYGIPEFRLPKAVVNKETNKIKNLNVKFQTNKTLGKDITINNLLKEYECIYIGIGAKQAKLMNIQGEDLNGFYNANDFLYEANLNQNTFKEKIKNKKVVVIGGGNVALDVARSSIRLEANKVDILYRRSIEESPACKDEIQQTIDENVQFNYLVNPIEILESENNKGHIGSIKCIKMKLDQPDENGRKKPIEIIGSDFIMDCDIVVEAISSKVEKEALSEIMLNKYDYPITDEFGKTSNQKVYAGGDVVDGPLSVVNAIRAGKVAAKAIDEYIKKHLES